MMHIVDMTDVLEYEDGKFYFAVFNTVNDRFLSEPTFGDQVWTKESWELSIFNPDTKERIRNLVQSWGEGLE